ncbi:DUF5105 domain-containing protein [Desulfosporosinus fructosivorans]
MTKFSHPSRCLLILVIITLVFSMAGCTKTNFPKAEESVNGFFKSLSEADLKTAESYCASDSGNFTFADPQEEKLAKLIFSKTKHEIVSSVEAGETATAKVKVTNLDLQKIFEGILGKVMDEALNSAFEGEEISDEKMEENMMKYLEESISKPDAPVLTNELEITLNKDKAKKMWVIQDNDALVNNLTGNLNEMLSQ